MNLEFYHEKNVFFSARELYGESSGRIRSSNLNINQLKIQTNFLKENANQHYKFSRSRERSPSYVQSRRFHPDQLARDVRDLGQPSSFTAQISSSYYSYGGPGTNLGLSNQEACRLTNTFCSRDYHCCSGKCRCVKWSIMGRMSCWKKCF
jgi:hypothetical protein